MDFDPRPLIRKLGKPNARPLEREEAGALFAAMLDGSLDDVLLGAAWMGLRIKGETPDELTAFLAAAESSYSHWDIRMQGGGMQENATSDSGTKDRETRNDETRGGGIPVVIPSNTWLAGTSHAIDWSQPGSTAIG